MSDRVGEPTQPTDDDHEIRPPWAYSDRRFPRRVVRPLQEFLQTSTSGAAFLLAAVLLALIWANSPWRASYFEFWDTHLAVSFGTHVVDLSLQHWINDGLMTLFFLLVGLEIKREFLVGELRQLSVAALPVAAAIGGMLLPAVLFVAINIGSESIRGWGVPMATDIAFSLGVLALVATHAPPTMKPLLLTLAIVDDVGAILVIAFFYTDSTSLVWLELAVLVVALLLLLQRAHVRSMAVYLVLGAILWYEFLRSGVHPTIAGVILGLLTPAFPFQRPSAVSREARRTAQETSDHPDPPDADFPRWLQLARLSKEAVSPLTRIEHALLPWSSFVILPLFGLANAGIEISTRTLTEALSAPIGVGIIVGLVVGKPLGIMAAGRLAVGARLASMPEGFSRRHLAGLGASAGIGFTVSLFIADLAFAGDALAQAKIAILLASLIAGGLGYVLLRWYSPRGSVVAEASPVTRDA